MKKFVVLFFSVFCFSIVSNAQTGMTGEEFDKIRDQMEVQMESMMKHLEKSFDMMEGGMIMMDTMMLNFGSMDENGVFKPNEKMESMMQDMELMMKDAFGDMNFEEMMPAIPGPDSMEEEDGKAPKNKKQSDKSKERKKKRKTSSL